MSTVVAPFAVAAVYCVGIRRCAGVRPSWRRGMSRLGTARVIAFLVGLAVTAAAMSTPVHHLTEDRLWLHMGQHMLLLVIAAPLLAAGSPGVPMLLLLPLPARRWVSRWRWRVRTHPLLGALFLPVTAWVLSVAALWLWHLPTPFEAAERSPVLHELEHATLLFSAWAFWWHVLRSGRRRMTGAVATLYVFGATLPMAALGAVLTFASHPLYPHQAAHAAANGMDPLVDQQLAGLVMWVPPEVLYLAVSAVLFLRWLHHYEEPVGMAAPPRRPVRTSVGAPSAAHTGRGTVQVVSSIEEAGR